MNTKHSFKPLLLAAALAAATLAAPAWAHRTWLLPSGTVYSGDEPWVTVDAAASNDIFYFEHVALRLDNLVVQAPDGAKVAAENQFRGRYRSSFDVKLAQKGTYKLTIINDGLFASYKDPASGETKRARGNRESLTRDIPAGAQVLGVTQSFGRLETFVTSGSPSTQALQPTGKGLELVARTHPNDLVAGESATFGFVLNGKPAADLPVTLIRHGIRYRDQLGEQQFVTDAKGEVTLKWTEPGMYWLHASPTRDGMSEAPSGTLDAPTMRYSYTATLEVLSP